MTLMQVTIPYIACLGFNLWRNVVLQGSISLTHGALRVFRIRGRALFLDTEAYMLVLRVGLHVQKQFIYIQYI